MLPQNNPDRIRILFDDHRLVANAGLLLPATLSPEKSEVNPVFWPGNRALRPQGRIVPSKPIVSNHRCGIICGNIRAMVPIPADYSLKTRGDNTPLVEPRAAPFDTLMASGFR